MRRTRRQWHIHSFPTAMLELLRALVYPSLARQWKRSVLKLKKEIRNTCPLLQEYLCLKTRLFFRREFSQKQNTQFIPKVISLVCFFSYTLELQIYCINGSLCHPKSYIIAKYINVNLWYLKYSFIALFFQLCLSTLYWRHKTGSFKSAKLSVDIKNFSFIL